MRNASVVATWTGAKTCCLSSSAVVSESSSGGGVENSSTGFDTIKDATANVPASESVEKFFRIV